MIVHQLLSTVIILLILIPSNNADTSSDTLKTNIIVTMKIFKYDIQSTNNDLLTILSDFEQRINIQDIKNLLLTLQSGLQQTFTDDQLINMNNYVSAALTNLDNIQNVTIPISELLREIIPDLTDAVTALDNLLSALPDDLTQIGTSLQTLSQNTQTRLNIYNDLIQKYLVNSVQSQSTEFNNTMMSIQDALKNQDNIMLNTNLLDIQSYFNEFMTSIGLQLLRMTTTIKDARDGFVTPLTPLLLKLSQQPSVCTDCVIYNVVTQRDCDTC
ncbi:unnamed protein product [Adineta steineri]|uniref:Uncharacterized protein n=1 Tax=Adineta steineri TaxID=433720 RepID=A0A814INM2_9BILA|nr:unnamed protein product [Adineta steineri]